MTSPSPVFPGSAATSATADSTVPADARPCPECGAPLTSDPRFVEWCPSCEWGALPKAPPANTRRDRLNRRFNRGLEQRLFNRVVTGGNGRRRSAPGGTDLVVFLLAGFIHLVTVALFAAGLALLLQPPWPVQTLGVLLVAVGCLFRPRLGPGRRSLRKLTVLERSAAPTLYALADRVAAEVGTTPAAVIAVDGRHNASYHRVGLRREVVLTLGLPLWETLTPEQRLALLGHEFGHGANGDFRRSLWVGSALRSLQEWYYLLSPGAGPYGRRSGGRAGRGLVASGTAVAAVVLAVFAALVLLFHRLLTRLTALSSRRGEYLADGFAVRVAANDAAEGLLEMLTLGSSVDHVVRRRRLNAKPVRRSRAGAGAGRVPVPAAVPRPANEYQPIRRPAETVTTPARPAQPAAADLWTELRSYIASIPQSERARRLVASRLEETAVDASHPPTHLRTAYVRQLPQAAPAIVLTTAEVRAIDAELAPLRAALALHLDGKSA